MHCSLIPRSVIAATLALLLVLVGFRTAFATSPAIYNFTAPFGLIPNSNLVVGSDGNFYGTTTFGGDNDNGIVFKVTPEGAVTTLCSFPGIASYYGSSTLVQGHDGNFYGTKTNQYNGSDGTIFKLTTNGTPAGTTVTTLAQFNGSNGSTPSGPLVEGNDGNFYGATQQGGSNKDGTVFRVTLGGVLTTLVNFAGANGMSPQSALIKGSDGNFYGTTAQGGSNSDGTVFKVTPGGVLTTLIDFTGANGQYPRSSLVQGTGGSFYGTTSSGGSDYGRGTVFKLETDGTAAGTTVTTLTDFTGSDLVYPNFLRGLR